jgi:hypothetical protein
MNDFILSNKDKTQQYFIRVATDPLAKDESEAWSDLISNESTHINIKDVDLSDLFELHRILDSCAHRLIPAIEKIKKEDLSKPAVLYIVFL